MIFIQLMTSDRKLKASREGSKRKKYGTYTTSRYTSAENDRISIRSFKRAGLVECCQGRKCFETDALDTD